GQEDISYPSDTIKEVLESTLGVPIFQEQVMKISMVAAGFTGSEADELRRAITNWGKNSKLLLFEQKFKQGLLTNGYTQDFADRLFEQVKGFGGYGFPESHSAGFAILCYVSSWIKCHHPAAFYCALLNSQPMGFYSPSQLIQDAQRHHTQVMPVDINKSKFENALELDANGRWGIRLGFCEVKSFDNHNARQLEHWRGDRAFTSLDDLARRSQLAANDLQVLASADVLKSLSGNRHQSRWQAVAIQPYREFLDKQVPTLLGDLFPKAPSEPKNILDEYRTIRLTLRRHPMALLRNQPPFNQCPKQPDLANKRHKGFVKVAGLVTGHQRPGTAKGTLFITLEDETGNINVVVWKGTQETYRKLLLTAKLLLIKGTVEIATQYLATPVIHVIAGQLHDYTNVLQGLPVKARSFK